MNFSTFVVLLASSPQFRRHGAARLTTLLACAMSAPAAWGFDIPSDNPDVKMRWDNTVKYSAGWRVTGLNETVAADTNGDDGDRNFKRGLTSSRFDLLSEFDVAYKNFGARVSGAAWDDTVYNSSNANHSDTVNSFGIPTDHFPGMTRTIMGRDAELLDAFVYLKNEPTADTAFNVRLGQYSIIYGESLFFGANGIANAQSPVDLIKLLSVPSSQFKEIIRPVPQISAQVQLTPTVSLGGYYQFQWEQTRLPASGSYLSDGDYVGAGAQRFLVAPANPAPAFFVDNTKAANSGQGGLALRFKIGESDIDYGLYAARYNDKLPQLYVRPTGGPPAPGTLSVGTLQLVYPEGINTFGASFSTVLEEANVSGEVSFRTNAPLVSDPQLVLPGQTADANHNPFYAVGKTAHAQISTIYLMTKNPIWDGASFLGEIAWNRVLSVDKNPQALDPNTTRDATALRFILQPSYFQVLPAVDLQVPIGLGYVPPWGRSGAVFKFNGGVENGGDLSIGLNPIYDNQFKFALQYTYYFGPTGGFLKPVDAFGQQILTFDQSLKDRNWISFSVQYTF
jgi:hypothetical protein